MCSCLTLSLSKTFSWKSFDHILPISLEPCINRSSYVIVEFCGRERSEYTKKTIVVPNYCTLPMWSCCKNTQTSLQLSRQGGLVHWHTTNSKTDSKLSSPFYRTILATVTIIRMTEVPSHLIKQEVSEVVQEKARDVDGKTLCRTKPTWGIP